LTAAIDQYVLLRAFVDELARCGMREACTSPGSRSAPLVLSLVRDARLRCHSHIDERAAGFFALGVAKASGRPAAVACTSGTAAAELLPAVVEAHEARVPMIILTADRPPELRDVGAGQTIDQIKLYGGAAKWFFEVGSHDGSEHSRRWMRTLACRAWHTATSGRPGPVHLNFALREPLVVQGDLPDDDSARPGERPFVEYPEPPPTSLDCSSAPLERLMAPGARVVLVAGRHERATPLGAVAADLCTVAGWPLLADPLSGARRGPCAIAHYDALLRDERLGAALRPEVVFRVGDLPPSKPLRSWLATIDDQLALDPEGSRHDPDAVLGTVLAVEPVAAMVDLAAAIGRAHRGSTEQAPWLAGWRAADALAAAAIDGVLAEHGLSEPLVAAVLGRLLPATATLFVASSMPVRDVETFWPAREDPPRVLCNRGANGIDGTISSALGAAAGSAGPVVLLIGDVAAAHDLGGLIGTRRLDPALAMTIVLLNNGGGGIFDFLPVANASMARDAYSAHIATPTGLDFALAARLAGACHTRVGDLDSLDAALAAALGRPGIDLVEVSSQRAVNVRLHREVWAAVAAAVS
jgi:2-succinyl-5-enolpyruvyl-6-hydroxy-3-cyclohexene-1-carboxylate synthase